MKQHLLPQKNAYRANLHMHTTISDGKMTPEETRAFYKRAGYSIVAFTDHEVLVPHRELREADFLPITSYEVAVTEACEGRSFAHRKTYHLNLFSKDPDKTFSSAFSASYVTREQSKPYIPKGMENFECPREYSVDCINGMIAKAREEGFLVSYNHPVWSLQNDTDYGQLRGLWGVEVYNTGCVCSGYVDTVQPLDDLLRTGERVFPLATDDAHAVAHCCGGWLWVLADKLEYADVMEALERGDFYASTGPEIYEISVEGNTLTVRTSSAVYASVASDRRVFMRAGDFDVPRCEFTFDLSRSRENLANARTSPYFRVTVQDERGREAWSRAYFFDELL